jgi:hypothetical protein
VEEDLSMAHLRLASVTIEHLDWRQVVEKYDRPHTLFFLPIRPIGTLRAMVSSSAASSTM